MGSVGNDTFYTAGNVGIGTATPAAGVRLHVSGIVRLDAGNEIRFVSDQTSLTESAGDLDIEADDDLNLHGDEDVDIDAVQNIRLISAKVIMPNVPGTSISSGVTTLMINAAGQLGTVAASRRYKEDIRDMAAVSRGTMALRPVTFRYRQPAVDGSKPLQYGLIAEEVAAVYPDLVVYDEEGRPETVQYYKMNAMLLNEVQKLYRRVEALTGRLTALEAGLALQRPSGSDD